MKREVVAVASLLDRIVAQRVTPKILRQDFLGCAGRVMCADELFRSDHAGDDASSDRRTGGVEICGKVFRRAVGSLEFPEFMRQRCVVVRDLLFELRGLLEVLRALVLAPTVQAEDSTLDSLPPAILAIGTATTFASCALKSPPTLACPIRTRANSPLPVRCARKVRAAFS